jgi:hypothetical protein
VRPAIVLTLVASAFMALPSIGAVQDGEERERIDVSQRGPQVGERIPDFTLDDQFGNTWTRESISGSNGTMLVFIRSADW